MYLNWLIPRDDPTPEEPALPPGFNPDDPFNTKALLPNFVCREVFGVLAVLLCWVPFRLLLRNGEFAAVVFISVNVVLMVIAVINAAIWHDDNLDAWWPGYGWCDLVAYISGPLVAAYAASIFAIMQNLATQVGMLRASPLTAGEKRRRNLVQAAIIFTIPLIDVAANYPFFVQRFLVIPLSGCNSLYDNSLPVVLLYYIWPSAFAIGAAVFAVLTWLRFREIEKTTRIALTSGSNSGASSRAQRAKRRLFLMSICILIPYLPIQLTLFVLRIIQSIPLLPYDFNRVHSETWGMIIFIPSTMLDETALLSDYIPIITVIPIFWFFGLTKDAINTYRTYLVAIGLGRVFPGLNEEYDPDRRGNTTASSFSRFRTQLTSIVKTKRDPSPSSRHDHHNTTLTTVTETSSRKPTFSTAPPDLDGPNPFPDYSAVPDPPTYTGVDPSTGRGATVMPARNPFTFRTAFDFGVVPSFGGGKKKAAGEKNNGSGNKKTRSGSTAGLVNQSSAQQVVSSGGNDGDVAMASLGGSLALHNNGSGNPDRSSPATWATDPSSGAAGLRTQIWTDGGRPATTESEAGAALVADGLLHTARAGPSSRDVAASDRGAGVTVHTDFRRSSENVGGAV